MGELGSSIRIRCLRILSLSGHDDNNVDGMLLLLLLLLLCGERSICSLVDVVSFDTVFLVCSFAFLTSRGFLSGLSTVVDWQIRT